NSTEGVVNHTLDMFLTSRLKICGEVQLRIHHHLLALPDADRQNITRIYSHQQSLAQCRQWLDAHWPQVERIAVSSHAEAARRASRGAVAATMAGEMAGELYGSVPIARNLEGRPNKPTRFLIVAPDQVAASGQDKT